MTGLSGAEIDSPKLAETVAVSMMKPGVRMSEVYKACSEAVAYGVRIICVPSAYLKEAGDFSKNTRLRITTIVSYPTGFLPVELKAMEVRLASEHGVEELYFYPNIGSYLDSRILDFEWELSKVAEVSQLAGLRNLKPVFEAETVSEEHMVEILEILEASGFESLAVSSGFGLKGMEMDGLRLLEKAYSSGLTVEAYCRIGSLQDVQNLVENGACRVYTLDYKVLFEKTSSRPGK